MFFYHTNFIKHKRGVNMFLNIILSISFLASIALLIFSIKDNVYFFCLERGFTNEEKNKYFTSSSCYLLY